VSSAPFQPEKLRRKLEPKIVSIELSVMSCSTPEKDEESLNGLFKVDIIDF